MGAGVAFIQASYEVIDSVKEDDSGVGYWIGTGVDWHFSRKMSLGVDIRYSQAKMTVFDNKIDAGGLHTVMTLGYRW